MPENGAEGRAADVLRHLNHVTEGGVGRPARAVAGNSAHDILTVPRKQPEFIFILKSAVPFLLLNQRRLLKN